MWDDGVAPETCIDFDAPQVNNYEMLKSWAGLLAFFAALSGYIIYTDPVGSNPVALRSTVIPYGGLRRELGLDEEDEEGEGGHGGHDEDEEEEDDDE